MFRVIQKTSKSCFAACVASIIECEFDDVPKWFHAPEWDHYAQRKWLSERGWGMVEHKLLPNSMWPPSDGVLCIVSGKSPRGDCEHACVAITQYDTAEPFRIVHDPISIEAYLPNSIDGDITVVNYLIPMDRFKKSTGKY